MDKQEQHLPNPQGETASAMVEKESVHMLLSRGLDGDLDRQEMRTLYRMAHEEDWVRREMGRMAALESSLHQFGLLAAQVRPAPEGPARIQAAIDAERLQQSSPPPAGKPNLPARFRQWLHSPHGLAIQPLSFAGGLAVAALTVWLTQPMGLGLLPGGAPENNQGALLALQANQPAPHFQAMPASGRGMGAAPALTAPPQAQTVRALHPAPEDPGLGMPGLTFMAAPEAWTKRFLVPPGEAARLSLQTGGDDAPIHLRMETVEPVLLDLAHVRRDTGEIQAHPMLVDGEGYAQLRQPRPGDAVIIRNKGAAPALVYLHTGQRAKTQVSRDQPRDL